jgi:hypothetical protein
MKPSSPFNLAKNLGGPQANIQRIDIAAGKFHGNLPPPKVCFSNFILGAVHRPPKSRDFFFGINWHGLPPF